MARTFASIAALTLIFAACGGGEQQQSEAAPQAAAPAATETTLVATPAAMPASELPPGVTPEMVAEGNTIFHGAGICLTCHGPDAKGMPGLGVNLTDSEWLHSDGSYEAIVKQIMTGVSATESKSGVAMPPKGGSTITDEQVKAVAAYVYSLRG
jgi:mono/diheme cytochrome c family protein